MAKKGSKGRKTAVVTADVDTAASPKLHQKEHEIQAWGHLIKRPERVAQQILAVLATLRSRSGRDSVA